MRFCGEHGLSSWLLRRGIASGRGSDVRAGLPGSIMTQSLEPGGESGQQPTLNFGGNYGLSTSRTWTGIGSLQDDVSNIRSEINTFRSDIYREASSRSSDVGRLERILGEICSSLAALESRLQEIEENYVRKI